MSYSQTQLKVRRSVRLLEKQITRRPNKYQKPHAFAKKQKPRNSLNTIRPVSFQKIVHQVSFSKQEYFSSLLLALKFIKALNPVDNTQLAGKSVHLRRRPMYENAKTIIFDLDETLVHCCEDPKSASQALNISLPSGEKLEIGINIRPYVKECLTTLSKKFEIVVFTASHKCYADVVLDFLDPTNELIHHRLYRENCVIVDGVYIKDLRVITNRALENMVLIDNSAYCFAYQLENGVPIVSWYNDNEDTELMELTHYLSSIETAKDVRTCNRDTFHLDQLSKNPDLFLTKL